MKDISLENISFRYHHHHRYRLQNVSLNVSQGSILGIFGPSGAGKTTLLFLICGLLKPECGHILVDGKNPLKCKSDFRDLRRKTGLAFQFPEDMVLQSAISEEFYKMMEKRDDPIPDIKQAAFDMLHRVGLDADSLWARHPLHLSHGELKRLSLALVWAKEPDLFILDEPTVGLDCQEKKGIMTEIIRYCRHEKKMCIMASQDTSTLLPFVDNTLILRDGKMIFWGTRGEILQYPEKLMDSDLSLPPMADLAIRLKKSGFPVHRVWEDLDQAIHEIMEIIPV